jgi:hypothetical protein
MRLPFLTVALPLLCAGPALVTANAYAEGIDFTRIDRFESFATGTLEVGAPPKTILNDGEPHAIILTIWNADADTKVYWKSANGEPRTTVIPGRGVQTFQTAGEFRLEAIGEPNHRVEYGYALLHLGSQ